MYTSWFIVSIKFCQAQIFNTHNHGALCKMNKLTICSFICNIDDWLIMFAKISGDTSIGMACWYIL